jgi:hypothetical protein
MHDGFAKPIVQEQPHCVEQPHRVGTLLDSKYIHYTVAAAKTLRQNMVIQHLPATRMITPIATKVA